MSYQSNINTAIGSITGATIGLKKSLSKDGKNTNKNDLNKQAGNKAKDALKETIESKSTTSPEETTKTIQEIVNVNKSEPEVSSYDIDDSAAIDSIFNDNNEDNKVDDEEAFNAMFPDENKPNPEAEAYKEKYKKYVNQYSRLLEGLYNKSSAYADEVLESQNRYKEFEKDYKDYNKPIISVADSDRMREKYDPTGEYDKKIHLNWKNSNDWYRMVKNDLIKDWDEKYKKYKTFNEAIDIYNSIKDDEEEDNGNN